MLEVVEFKCTAFCGWPLTEGYVDCQRPWALDSLCWMLLHKNLNASSGMLHLSSVYVCVCVEGWWGRGGGVVTTSTMGLAGPVLGFAWAEGGLLCLVGLPACLSKNYWSVTSYFNTPWWLCLYHKYVMGFSLASLLVYILIWGQKSDIISVQTHRLSDIIPSDCCQVLFCSLHIVCMCHNK